MNKTSQDRDINIKTSTTVRTMSRVKWGGVLDARGRALPSSSSMCGQPCFPFTGTLVRMHTPHIIVRSNHPPLQAGSAGLLALTVFIHVCLFIFSYFFYRLMILFFVASFSCCMAETRSCAAGTHSFTGTLPPVTGCAVDLGYPLFAGSLPTVTVPFSPKLFPGVPSCSSFRKNILTCKQTINMVARGQNVRSAKQLDYIVTWLARVPSMWNGYSLPVGADGFTVRGAHPSEDPS